MIFYRFRDQSGIMESSGIRGICIVFLFYCFFNTLGARLDELMGCKSSQPDNQGKTP